MSNEPNKYSLVPVRMMAAERPVFLEKNGKDWVYFGKDNNYPNYLVELKRRSIMHSTIIDKKVRLISGGGWKIDKAGLNTLDNSILQDWIKAPNGIEDLNELTKKVTYDLETFDGVYIQVIYDKAGRGKKTQLAHIPFEFVRRNKDCSEFYFTTQWFKTGSDGKQRLNSNPQEAEDWKVFKPYDPKDKTSKSQIYFYDCYSIGKDVYPLPNYLAGITAVETEARIDNFWLNFIKRGFSPAHIINFYNGIPTPEEQDKIKKQITDTYTGDDIKDFFVLNFSQDKDHGSEISASPTSDLDKQFQQLKETTQQSILQIHGISNPTMLGIKTAGQLGSRDELVDAVEEFQNFYVTPRQNIIEYIFNELLSIKGFEGRMKLKQLKPLSIDITNEKIWTFLSDDEKRDHLGLEPKQGKIETNAIADAINSLSPLVANKVLESMSVDEIRSMIGLKSSGVNGVSRTSQTMQSKFAEVLEDGLVDLFSKHGFEKGGEVKQSRDFEFTSEEDLDQSELLFKETFADDNKDGLNVGLPEAKIETPPTGTPKVKLQVVYSYEGAQDSRNRAFCAKMLSLNRYYTKEDMRAINAEIKSNDEYASAFGDLDINVWRYRGGWYRKAGTDTSRPHCRHRWQQNLILKDA